MLDPVILGRYIQFCESVRKLGKRTVYEYLYIIRLLSNFYNLMEAKKPSEVEEGILKAQNSGTVVWGDGYTYKVSRVVKQFYDWAVTEELIPFNPYPFTRFKKPRLKEPKFLTTEQWEQIITLPSLTLQQKSYLMLTWDTGVRRCELLALDRSNVELKILGHKRNGVTIPKTKGGYSDNRYCPFTDETATCLHQHVKNIEKHARGPWLWIDSEMNRLSETTIGREVSEIGLIKTPYKEPIRLHLHLIRHSLGGRLVAAGYPDSYIQRLLGHTTSHMTQHYTHYCKDTMDQMYQKLAPQTIDLQPTLVAQGS